MSERSERSQRKDESFDDWLVRLETYKTDPPTMPLGVFRPPYGDRVIVQWVCPCSETKLEVFYEEGYYRTFVKCPACGKQEDVHTG